MKGSYHGGYKGKTNYSSGNGFEQDHVKGVIKAIIVAIFNYIVYKGIFK